ncbi:two-component sensor histidine kinase [Pseudomonas sp. SDI]|uniref:sensor histidine kinase n=1 Tax=Pseudomonas sp. SDI TaxID=2170734 RepID=UPI000DE63944|nr:HAMP domain-containing sensor histidine kinase [Pseudomonas sp. SDI]PWB32390.1 two-component sensor histidine kinase [Pseudomonas sp. SDI]
MQMLNNDKATLAAPSTPSRVRHQRQFNLLRWFSLVSLVIITSVAVGLGYVSTAFVVNESVERDAMLTAQFIQAMAHAEVRHAQIAPGVTMGDLLDPRMDDQYPNVDAAVAAAARIEFLDHVEHLPDTLLANVYAHDRTVVWSTNPQLIGKKIEADDDLDESFESRVPVSSSYHKADEDRDEQKFLREPNYLFIENYIPMFNSDGSKVVSMVEVYKEPQDLVRRIQRGYVLIWGSTAIGGVLVYLGLFWIVRRGANMLASQQTQLIASETFVALGEMSSAVAHSLRNPLATIRSSAELAHDVASVPAQKNIDDIISQVDRMSRWVRELLVSLRPVHDDAEAVDLLAAIDDTRAAFAPQIKRNAVQLQVQTPPTAMVVSQPVLLTQILNSLFSNALEAMPGGGRLSIEVSLLAGGRQLQLLLSDTGKGMSQQQERMVFKPFFTTKQGGLGVGLVLVKRIMERFGGAVSLTSREEEGTRVSLTFNVAGGDHGTQHSGGRG